MPFTTNTAPPDVRDRFTGRCLEVWVETFNETLERHGDEGRAFATAETAGKKCKEAKSMPDLAVKFTGADTIAGLAIPFGGPFNGKDFDGEAFTPETDFCIEWFGEAGRPVLYDHGLDDTLKSAVVGRQVSYEVRDEGVWVEVQLDRRAKYAGAVRKLVDEGALSFSSGAMPHLTAKNANGYITRWPWVELSLTPIPANPDAQVYAVKAADAVEHLEAVNVSVPDPLKAALKALDEWADNTGEPHAGEPVAENADRVLADVKALTDRLHSIAEMRAKAGRAVSRANWERARAIAEAMETGLADLKAFLAEHDPEAEKALGDAELDALRTLARLNGAPV